MRHAGDVWMGSGVHTRPKFEIGVVELLARKRDLSSAPRTTSTTPLGGQTETPEFGVPLNPEQADLGRSKQSRLLWFIRRKKTTNRLSSRGVFGCSRTEKLPRAPRPSLVVRGSTPPRIAVLVFLLLFGVCLFLFLLWSWVQILSSAPWCFVHVFFIGRRGRLWWFGVQLPDRCFGVVAFV